MQLIEMFRFKFPVFRDVSDADVQTAIDMSKGYRLSGRKDRGDDSQILYAAYIISSREYDQKFASHDESLGVGIRSGMLGDETRTFVTGNERASSMRDPMGFYARYEAMKGENRVFIATAGRRIRDGQGW